MKNKTASKAAPKAAPSEKNNPVTCPECGVGYLKNRSVAYFTWLGEEMITVPDFPAWVCDICGRREYDPQALNWLAVMLSPHIGKPMHRYSGRKSSTREVKKGQTLPISSDPTEK